MAWLLIHSRDRDLFVAAAEAGHPTYTRDPDRALRFDGQAAARKWIDRHAVTSFGELALMRERRSTAPKQKSPNEGSRGSKGNLQHEQNTTFSGSPAD